eukprot:TRINITY_DN11753_c0_g1_i2.p1 TRINITY_DN11753_c0_g1~~TRINITY_DN11753_c0_g1_i2.p1  ORF type:complete len:271 (+),score=122.27 TRINITY_DN11753_c0_g1_i2:43-813(+)
MSFENWQEKYPTPYAQCEFFLLKNASLDRKLVVDLRDDFLRYDSNALGELEEDAAMRLLEDRGETKTFVELRQMINEVDKDRNRTLAFLEWSVAYFKTNWDDLWTSKVDEEELRKALEAAAEAEAEYKKVKELEAEKKAMEEKALEEKAAKEAEEREAAEQLEATKAEQEAKKAAEEKAEKEAEEKRSAELSGDGVKGAAAFFKYAAVDSGDSLEDNRRQIGRHTSELQSHSFISYAVFCLKKKKTPKHTRYVDIL